MPSPPYDGALAEIVHYIEERALRKAMAMVNRLQPAEGGDAFDLALAAENQTAAYRRGHQRARMQIYDEIERMIAREAPAPDAVASDDDGGC